MSDEANEPRDHLIRCAGGEQRDDCLWWRPERSGYTAFVDEAGRYTRTEAEAQQRSRPDKDVAVLASEALAAARSVVRRERLHWTPPPAPRRVRRPERCGVCAKFMPADSDEHLPCESGQADERGE
jgi:hypothetical protein